MGPSFLIPCIILHQKHPLGTIKKFVFNFFHTKMTFLPLWSQRPWLDLWFFAPALKNYAPTSILIILWCLENKKKRPSLCSTRLGRARLRYIWICHGRCDKKGKNVIFVWKNWKHFFFHLVMRVFDVKWSEESKKVSPYALWR